MAADETLTDGQAQPEKPKNKKYRRDKPWDHEGIDHWKVDPWTEDDSQNCAALLEESSFATLFPKYRYGKCPSLRHHSSFHTRLSAI